MEDPRILYRRRRERQQEYRELAAQSCYSVIFVILALIALRPLMVDQILSRAEAYSVVGLLDESRRQCDKALLIDDDSSQAWYQLARIHKVQGNREMACAAYERAVQANSPNWSAHFELGMIYMDEGRYPLAIPHLEQVRKLGLVKTKASHTGQESYHRAALHMLLRCYEKVGDPVKTELTLKEIRIFCPDGRNETEPPVSFPPDNSAR